MKFLLDTHVVMWAASMPERLSATVRELLEDDNHQLFFSVASIWESAVKEGLGRADFRVDTQALRRGLLDNGYTELEITGMHCLTVRTLPALHRDPFDRLLVAQSLVEGFTLLTADSIVAQYPGSIRLI